MQSRAVREEAVEGDRQLVERSIGESVEAPPSVPRAVSAPIHLSDYERGTVGLANVPLAEPDAGLVAIGEIVVEEEEDAAWLEQRHGWCHGCLAETRAFTSKT